MAPNELLWLMLEDAPERYHDAEDTFTWEDEDETDNS